MTQVEKRKKFIIDVVYFVILLMFVAVFLKYAFYPLLPIFIALIIALVLQRPMKFLSRKLKVPKALVATVLVLVLMALLFLGVYAIGDRLLTEGIDFVKHISEYVSDYDWIHDQVYGILDSLPGFMQDSLRDNVDELMNNLEILMSNDPEIANKEYTISISSFDFSKITEKLSSGVSTGVSGLVATAKQIPSILIAVIICIILSVFMTIEYDEIIGIIESMMNPESTEKFQAVRRVMKQSVGKLMKAYAVICSMTFIELSVGLFVLRAMGIYKGGYIVIIAIITALLDILPVLGIGTVMWPWMAFCLFSGDTKMLLGLFVIYAIITVVRHIIEPKLVSDTMELPAALTLSIMYIGLKFFGVLGMFAFILILYVVVALNREGVIHLTYEEREAEELPPPATDKEEKKLNL
ncbi:MAG: AI-2E family transporter [Clostridia bacterium]|nr:AI-2E family transporter [Clostridia bacterium]MBR6479467.1 AI-2E family transporter [Clostridia bacterium]MBR6512491.1 AI-2E family transporter [Clostridia bacterium]